MANSGKRTGCLNAIDMISSNASAEEPFMSCAAFTGPHFPIAVPEHEPLDLEGLAEDYSGILGYCTFIDDQIGRVIDELKRQSLYDNTVIIYSSDHGDMLGSHLLFNKGCHRTAMLSQPCECSYGTLSSFDWNDG